MSQAWKYLRWLPRFLLKKMFTKQKLAGMVYFDVQPRYTSARVDLGESASAAIYFQLINMSPFDIELDRADIEFLCAGVKLNIKHIIKLSLLSGEKKVLHVCTDISDAKRKQIAEFSKESSSSICISSEFNCVLHNFSQHHHSLEGVNVEFSNANSN